MNIYFSGIGGVGIGPLAEIAYDADYAVLGSDPAAGLMTKQLSQRGIAISTDQSGEFLRTSHQKQPIDWLVHTSALPPSHPELRTARELGIKTTKRDELIAHILKEKKLKLLAVAGTHGKTTTSALLVWTFKQLDVPISYSIGTTLSFGPSGHYDPTSEYFIYECDEYDRNMLRFQPHLTIIPSLSYDHPDTYPTEADYRAAFKQFLSQSQASILWQHDADLMGAVHNAWVLDEHDITPLMLPGEHVRCNASLIVKAFERLGISGDSIKALNSFPGVDRRFEKLADNLYSDYAVHPREIATTIATAHELNTSVVAIYQPHQNVRQHEVRNGYTNELFEKAAKVYWLPTYLTRENPALEVLTPKQLASALNPAKLHIAELNDELWQAIQNYRNDGYLVLCMGAGPIDGWLRERLATLD
jgi:UDP-N-acetylmuramate--alanine ligase